MTARPVLALDVDGVLNPFVTVDGFIEHIYDGPDPSGNPVSMTVQLSSAHGNWISGLADLGIEVVWATSWGQLANTWIAPRLGLAYPLPVVEVGVDNAPRFGRSMKLGPIADYARGRPLCWVDDQFGGREFGWAEDRTRDGLPTSLIEVDYTIGVTTAEIDEVALWVEQCRNAG